MDEDAELKRLLDAFLEKGNNDVDNELMNSEGDGVEPEIDVGDEVMRLLSSEGEGLELEQLEEAVPSSWCPAPAMQASPRETPRQRSPRSPPVAPSPRPAAEAPTNVMEDDSQLLERLLMESHLEEDNNDVDKEAMSWLGEAELEPELGEDWLELPLSAYNNIQY
jgi:hypothetical protein